MGTSFRKLNRKINKTKEAYRKLEEGADPFNLKMVPLDMTPVVQPIPEEHSRK